MNIFRTILNSDEGQIFINASHDADGRIIDMSVHRIKEDGSLDHPKDKLKPVENMTVQELMAFASPQDHSSYSNDR